MRGPPGPLEAAPSPPSPFLLVAPQSALALFPSCLTRGPRPSPPPVQAEKRRRRRRRRPAARSLLRLRRLPRPRSLAPPPPVFFLFCSFVVASPPFPSFPAKHRWMLFPCPVWRRTRTRSEHSFGGREREKNARFGDQSSSRAVDQAPSRDTEQALEKRAIDNYAQHSFSFLKVLFFDDFGRLLLCVKLECMFISVFCLLLFWFVSSVPSPPAPLLSSLFSSPCLEETARSFPPPQLSCRSFCPMPICVSGSPGFHAASESFPSSPRSRGPRTVILGILTSWREIAARFG